jgi:glycosyltransferase involved in cell wall biosynthesis
MHFVGLMKGGVETFILSLYRHVDRSRIQFDLALPEQSPCECEEEVTALGGRIVRFPAPGQTSLSRLRRALWLLLRDNGPYAAIHSHMFLFSALPLGLAHRLKVPVRIVHSHVTGAEARPGWRRSLYRLYMLPQVSRHATHVFACSGAAGEALLGPRWSHDPRAKAIPNAVSLDPFAAVLPDRTDLRKRLGLPVDTPLLGFVGRMTPVKNPFFLVEVLGRLREQLSAVELVLVGDGELRGALERHASRLGLVEAVHFLGLRRDIPEIMSALDALLLPSYSEGLPLVAIEAQAAGTPILCSEAVPPEADLGLGLVQRLPLDQGAGPWLAALSEALEIPRPSWERRRERFAATGYDAAALARRMEAVYLGEDRAS